MNERIDTNILTDLVRQDNEIDNTTVTHEEDEEETFLSMLLMSLVQKRFWILLICIVVSTKTLNIAWECYECKNYQLPLT